MSFKGKKEQKKYRVIYNDVTKVITFFMGLNSTLISNAITFLYNIS